ncbi:MAG: helix-hairpin-helix domain-containing protein [Actinomycetaceae bacterium]|nr:helix-hairpin-helix domain-containing protein [Actinomycetaceae bacterium]
MASLALASGTGEDVAALADAAPRPRWRLDRQAVTALTALMAVICLAVWGWMVFQDPGAGASELKDEGSSSRSAPLASAPRASDEPAPAASGEEGGEIVVYVSGHVAQPGVYTLPAGARIGDVVAAAGGLTPEADTSLVNLAAPVADGDHLHVVATGEQPVTDPAGQSAAGTGQADGQINVNTASEQELQELPGVGPVTAASIVEWREENGRFESVDDLLEVSGIGEATLDKFRDRVAL